jgi:hypothetical protein
LERIWFDLCSFSFINKLYFFRGFLKGDKLWGAINYKLQGLETNCEVHESADVSMIYFTVRSVRRGHTTICFFCTILSCLYCHWTYWCEDIYPYISLITCFTLGHCLNIQYCFIWFNLPNVRWAMNLLCHNFVSDC